MARFALALNAGVVLVPGQSVLAYQFVPVNVAEVGGQTGSVVADVTAINSSLGTLVTAIGAGTGSADAAALQLLVNTGSTDAAAANSAATGADVVISVNSSNITTVTELRRAFDRAIDLAKGGYGGLTQ